MQLYAWTDHEEVYCLGIGTEEKSELAVERIKDQEAYSVAHALFVNLLAQARTPPKAE